MALAGHPPIIRDEIIGDYVVFSYNECKSVPVDAVRRAFKAISRAKLLPDTAKLSCVDGRILITVPLPNRMPTDRRTSQYKNWRKPLYSIIHAMNICIQSEREPHELVAHIGSVALNAA
jgi:hypothetical protein